MLFVSHFFAWHLHIKLVLTPRISLQWCLPYLAASNSSHQQFSPVIWNLEYTLQSWTRLKHTWFSWLAINCNFLCKRYPENVHILVSISLIYKNSECFHLAFLSILPISSCLGIYRTMQNTIPINFHIIPYLFGMNHKKGNIFLAINGHSLPFPLPVGLENVHEWMDDIISCHSFVQRQIWQLQRLWSWDRGATNTSSRHCIS